MLIEPDISLKNYTSFKIGGVARYFCNILTREDLLECFKWIRGKKIKYFILGGGSNLLVSDSGFRGIVLKINNRDITWLNDICSAEAGVFLAGLINEACSRNLGGMEWAYGIPATLGGAVYNNAGAFGSNMAFHVKNVEVFDIQKGKFRNFPTEKCAFGYRKSIFQGEKHWLIWRIGLSWIPKNSRQIQEEINFFLEKRKNNQPLGIPSAGSFFRNPDISGLKKEKITPLIEDFVVSQLAKFQKDKNRLMIEKEIRDKIKRDQSLPAGYLIEKVGLKGKKIGGAQISPKHANFIVNTGQAKAEDVVTLASIIKQKVRNKFGVQLREEVEYVGF